MGLCLRTEEIIDESINNYYVATEGDKKILDKLVSSTPILLEGSRGMGKSFLFKVSEMKVKTETNILPVYCTFRTMPTLQTGNNQQFYIYMLSKLSSLLLRELRQRGYVKQNNWIFDDNIDFDEDGWPQKLKEINKQFEDSWKNPGVVLDTLDVPTIDNLLELAEDICKNTIIERIIFYIDEAAHVFIPEQQEQFFSLFRELRSPYVKCNAAVYPGMTHYGPTFDIVHDAELVCLSRNITDSDYLSNMKEMVLKQEPDENVKKALEKNDERFSVLAFAASGNPRTLLRSIQKLDKKFNAEEVNKFIRKFYREEIWAEHSSLVDKYPAREKYIEWGRKFVEDNVIPELKNKNDKLIPEMKESTIYFWIQKNAPQGVIDALKIMEYTGLIKLHSHGVKGTGSAIGTRYEVNFGCLLAQETSPSSRSDEIISCLALRRFSEYGANNKLFSDMKNLSPDDLPNRSIEFEQIINQSIDQLELTLWQKERLKEIGINTIRDLLIVEEEKLMTIKYVGDCKSRRMKNVVMAAVFEYLY